MKYIKHPWLFLLLSVVITVVVKIPHLGLPYFFDEAFSYIPAIEEMAKNGPNLLPGTISLYSSKGHPLLFYFLASIWLKLIAGNSIVLMRLFPFFNDIIGSIGCISFFCQTTHQLCACQHSCLITYCSASVFSLGESCPA